MKRALPVGLGLMALAMTIALISDGIALAIQISDNSTVRTTSIILAALEAIVWAMLAWFVSTAVFDSMSSLLRRSSTHRLFLSFGCAGLACLLAAILSIVNIVCLANLGDSDRSSDAKQSHLLTSSVILPVTVACQLSFLGVYFLSCRRNKDEGAESLYTNDEYRPSPKFHVKSVPYSKTRPSLAESRPGTSQESFEMTLESKKSFQVSASPRSSMSQSIRSMPSKSRLEAIKEKQRLPSLDSNACRPSTDEHDEWDAQKSSSPSFPALPKPRLLETIPASPVVPERMNLTDLRPPPPIRQRSRSYSPVASRSRSRTSSPTPSCSTEELNIHPLFRSDSPTPPPVASAGTSVMASPDAGKVLPHRPSNQSLRRLRSSSACSSASPLSRRTSFETPSLKKPCDEQDSILEVDEDDDSATVTEEELIPPTPEFVMGAGCRSSLTRYNSKRSDHQSEPQQKSS